MYTNNVRQMSYSGLCLLWRVWALPIRVWDRTESGFTMARCLWDANMINDQQNYAWFFSTETQTWSMIMFASHRGENPYVIDHDEKKLRMDFLHCETQKWSWWTKVVLENGLLVKGSPSTPVDQTSLTEGLRVLTFIIFTYIWTVTVNSVVLAGRCEAPHIYIQTPNISNHKRVLRVT